MYRIVCRYLDGPWGSPSHQLKSLLEDAVCSPRESKHMTAVVVRNLWKRTGVAGHGCLCHLFRCFVDGPERRRDIITSCYLS